MSLLPASLAALLVASSLGVPVGEDVRWHADLDEAFAVAAESGRPLLVVFR